MQLLPQNHGPAGHDAALDQNPNSGANSGMSLRIGGFHKAGPRPRGRLTRDNAVMRKGEDCEDAQTGSFVMPLAE